MKRTCLTVAAVLTLVGSVGCCYRPGAINPYNGIAYGGRWEPMPGGPLDVTACYGPNFCCPPVMTGYDVCEPPCAAPAVGPYMGTMGVQADCYGSGSSYPPMYAPPAEVVPHGTESVPGGVQPVPDPNITPKTKNGGATTYVLPQHLPFQHGSPINQASNVPWVQAH
jgi:hypothetical protein